MTPEEIATHNEPAAIAWLHSRPLQYLHDNEWRDYTYAPGSFPSLTRIAFRPKPEPVTRDWCKPDDVPGPVCWIRNNLEDAMITSIAPNGIKFTTMDCASDCIVRFLRWDELGKHQHSTDRINWNPCKVTEGEPASQGPAHKPHNPANLTPEQVGVAEGWRLLDVDEIAPSQSPVHGINLWMDSEEWSVLPSAFGDTSGCTYRTKLTREELKKARGL